MADFRFCQSYDCLNFVSSLLRSENLGVLHESGKALDVL